MTKELEFLINISKAAGALITENMEVFQKGENDLVTNFDLMLEKYIISQIKENFPNFDIVSEEFNPSGKLTENCFVIDPIDGTINFANNFPLWAIQLACVKNGKTCAAAIYVPKLNELFYADEGGAFLNGKKITVSNLPKEKTICAVEGGDKISRASEIIGSIPHIRSTGSSAISFAFTAAGRFGAHLFSKDSPWDFVPGIYICKMAGAKIIEKKNCHIAANSLEYAKFLENVSDKMNLN